MDLEQAAMRLVHIGSAAFIPLYVVSEITLLSYRKSEYFGYCSRGSTRPLPIPNPLRLIF